MKFNFEKKIDRKNTNCYKWDGIKYKFERTDILPMWVADLDFETPQAVKKAIMDRAKHGVLGYTFRPESYYEAFIDWNKKRHDWGIKRRWLLDTPGVVPGISFAIQEFSNENDNILVQSPVYDPFFNAVTYNNRNLIKSSLKNINNKYFMDFKDLEDKFKNQDIKIMILCSPHNPVGRVWEKEELLQLAELCIRYRILIISDEIHSDLVFKDKKHFPIAKLSEEIAHQSITFNSPAKSFSLAGLTTSFAIIPNEEIAAAFKDRLFKNGLFVSNIFGIIANEAAYNYGEDWLEELLVYLKGNYDFIKKFLRKRLPTIKLVQSDGTFLAWLDFSKLYLSQDDLYDLIINRAKVGLVSGVQYGIEGKNFMRMNIGCSRKIIEEALKRIENVLN